MSESTPTDEDIATDAGDDQARAARDEAAGAEGPGPEDIIRQQREDAGPEADEEPEDED